jgi:phosphoribosylformylglycinamidine cyclo-ligase
MPDELYDIAGFAVGVADRSKIIDGAKISEGDALVGIVSSGPHSNGFSLIRKTLPNLNEDFGGMPLGMALLEPTRLYVKPVLSVMEKVEIHGMAHITGGGFYENIPRMFKRGGAPPLPPAPHSGSSGAPLNGGGPAPVTPPAFDAIITEGSWTIPPIFARIAAACHGADCSGAEAQKLGAELLATDAVLKKQMFNTFNMGIGFVMALAPADVRQTIEHLDGMGFPAYEIGHVAKAADASAAEGQLRFV